MKTYSAFPVIVPHLILLPQFLTIKRTKKTRKHFLGFIVVIRDSLNIYPLALPSGRTRFRNRLISELISILISGFPKLWSNLKSEYLENYEI